MFELKRKIIAFAMLIMLAFLCVSCAPKVEEEKVPDAPITEGEGETTPTLPEEPSGNPYIDEDGNEAIKEDTPPSQTTPEGTELFFAEEISEYEEYDIGFISASMEGMKINDVVLAWGEPDMIQAATYAYFTDLRDLVIHFDEVTGEIVKVEEIINE